MSLDGPPPDEAADRPIRLLDSTVATASRPPDASPPPSETATPPTSAPGPASILTPVLHRPRGDTIRRELTRLKYARFQEGRYGEQVAEGDGETQPGTDEAPQEPPTTHPKHAHQASLSRVRSKLDSQRQSILGQSRRPRAKKHSKKAAEKEYAVDILYENQRGWFLCGVPFYSSKSLLNFDPEPWQTGDFRVSPVDITNAQVPDPTWVWAWPSWYVDMSHDVDEEGWEYNLSFRQGFAWHGSSPWWHSFVRRRRWLRKRIRAHAVHVGGNAWHKAHAMNADYFTIHAAADAAADSSRASSMERGTVGLSTIMGEKAEDSEPEDDNAPIPDVASLLARLKRTTVDRKKLDAFKQFINMGGAELYYLADAMPTITAMFMYQHSRRQILGALERAIDAAKERSEAQSQAAAAATSTPEPHNSHKSPPRLDTSVSGTSVIQPTNSKSPAATNQRAGDLERALTAVSTEIHALDLVPDASIRSPTSPQHHRHHSSHHSHRWHWHPQSHSLSNSHSRSRSRAQQEAEPEANVGLGGQLAATSTHPAIQTPIESIVESSTSNHHTVQPTPSASAHRTRRARSSSRHSSLSTHGHARRHRSSSQRGPRSSSRSGLPLTSGAGAGASGMAGTQRSNTLGTLPEPGLSLGSAHASQLSLPLSTITTGTGTTCSAMSSHEASPAGSNPDLVSSPTREMGADGIFIKGIPAAAHVGEDVGLAARMEAAAAEAEAGVAAGAGEGARADAGAGVEATETQEAAENGQRGRSQGRRAEETGQGKEAENLAKEEKAGEAEEGTVEVGDEGEEWVQARDDLDGSGHVMQGKGKERAT